MKSFFQRFYDSQPGASQSRVKDVIYRQRIPSSQMDKDRSQLNNSAEHEIHNPSKQRASKTVRPRPVPNSGVLGHVTTDYSTQLSAVPGSSTSRYILPPLPLPQSHPPNLKPLDDSKEKAGSSSKRNEARDLSGNGNNVDPRTKSGRLGRSWQAPAPPVSQQQTSANTQMGTTDKRRNKERLRQVDESDGSGTRAPRRYDYHLDRNKRSRERGPDQELSTDSRQRIENKGEERRERHREEVRGRVARDVQQWEQQEKVNERERLEECKEKEKQRDRTRERQKDEDRGRNERKEKERVRERERGREIEIERGKERNKEKEKQAREKLQWEMEAKQSQSLRDQTQRETKEQQERERRANELGEQERRERKAREARERQAERDRREQLELQRKEREHRAAEQRERERQQQEMWEREQDERERKERERLNRDRRREERWRKELRQRESDQKKVDLFKVERGRQDQKKNERDEREQQRERECEDRERRWRGESRRETPEAVLTDTTANDKRSTHSRKGNRQVSDSERETSKAKESERQRLPPLAVQADIPSKSEGCIFPDRETGRSAKDIANRNSKSHNPTGGMDISIPRQEDPQQSSREDWYISEQNMVGQLSKDLSGPSADPLRPRLPSIREIRPSPPTHTQLFMKPLDRPTSGVSTQPVEHIVPIVPTYRTRVTLNDVRTSTLEGSGHVSRLLEEAQRKSRASASDARPSTQQSNSDTMNFLKSARSSSPSGPKSTKHQLQAVQLAVFNSTALTAASERLQDISFPSATTQPLVPHVLPINTQDTISSKDTQSSESTEVHAQLLAKPSPYPKAATYSAKELLEYPSSVVQRPPSNPPTSKDLTSDQSQKHYSYVPITDSVRSNAQSSSLSRPSPYGPLFSQSLIPATNSTPPTDLPIQEQIMATRQESGSQENRQEDCAQQLSQSLPLDPLSPAAVSSRPDITEKQSNVEPTQYEDLMSPLIDTKPTHTSCPSPPHPFNKICNGTSEHEHNDKILLHPSKQDSKLTHTDQIPSQEITSLLYRQDLSNKFDRQENDIRTPISPGQTQPGRIQLSESLRVGRNHQKRYHSSARAPPPMDNHSILLPRHRRYHSDTETGRQGTNPSPLAESSHSIDVQLTGPGGSKHKPDSKEIEQENPRVDVRESNVAFCTSVLEPVRTIHGKHPATLPLSNKPSTIQEILELEPQKRKHDARGVPILVPHHEQLEEIAHLGGQIARSGTTIPRSTIRSEVPSPQMRVVVPSTQSLAVPEVDRSNTVAGTRHSVSSRFPSQSRNAPDTSSRQGQPSVVQPQAAYVSVANAQFDNDTVVRKDNSGNPAREPTVIRLTQPHSHKESSPQVRPRDDQPKLSPFRDGNIDDDQTLGSRQAHRGSRGTVNSTYPRYVQRTEFTETEDVMAQYVSEPGLQPSQPPAYSQLPSTDDKNRNVYDSDNYSSQRTPPHDPVAVSAQRTGTHHEEVDPRSQKNSAQVKDSRLAELLSHPKPSDVPVHSYPLGVRRHLDNSPGLVHGHSGNDATSRPQGPPGHGEQSPRHGCTGDSSPSGDIHSFLPNQQPDLPIRENNYLRSSPNISHHTSSFRVKIAVADSHTFQSSLPGEMSRSGLAAYIPRQLSAREKQDTKPDTEEVFSLRHNYDVDTRIDERSKSSHVPAPVYHQISDLQTRKTISQKDVARKYADEPSQPIISTHSRTRSDPQIMPGAAVLQSRHAYNDSCNTTSIQTLPVSVTSSSAPTIPSLGHLSDQMQNSYSYSSNLQSPTTREEVPAPPPSMEASPMKYTLSQKNHITPLSQDVSNTGMFNSRPVNSKPYEIWLPSTSSRHNQALSRATPISGPRRDSEREKDRVRQSAQRLPYQPHTIDPLLANAYHYIKTRKIRTMSTASLEAQDGAASTVVGSPTTSILSQIPINIPPEQDPILAAREWTEAAAIRPGQRIRRPGLVWELPEDPPPIYQQEHRRPESRSARSRRSRLSNSQARETSDTD